MLWYSQLRRNADILIHGCTAYLDTVSSSQPSLSKTLYLYWIERMIHGWPIKEGDFTSCQNMTVLVRLAETLYILDKLIVYIFIPPVL